MIFLICLLASGWTPRDQAERAVALLSYIGADYGSAVAPDGSIMLSGDFNEQLGFMKDAAADLQQAGASDLASRVRALTLSVERRVPPADLAPQIAQLGTLIEQRFQLSLLPPEAPDPVRGRKVYLKACAACHGREGEPDVRALELSTRPPAFAIREQVARLSPRKVFSAVTFGVPGTSMPEFRDGLPERDRWDVAWYVLALPHRDPAAVRRGQDLLRRLPRRPDYLQLAMRTDDQIRRALSGSPFSNDDREAIISACRNTGSHKERRQVGR